MLQTRDYLTSTLSCVAAIKLFSPSMMLRSWFGNPTLKPIVRTSSFAVGGVHHSSLVHAYIARFDRYVCFKLAIVVDEVSTNVYQI